jgi:hypothetical protein
MPYTRKKKGGNNLKSEIKSILDEVIKSNEYYVDIAKEFHAKVNEIDIENLMKINILDIRNLPSINNSVSPKKSISDTIPKSISDSILSSGNDMFSRFKNVNVDETYNTIYEEFQYGKTIYNQLIENHSNKQSNKLILTMSNLNDLSTKVRSYTNKPILQKFRKTIKKTMNISLSVFNSRIATDIIQIGLSPSRSLLSRLTRKKNSVAPYERNNVQYNTTTSEIHYKNYIISDKQIKKDNTVVTYDEQNLSIRIQIDTYIVEISIVSDEDEFTAIHFFYKKNNELNGIKRVKDRMYVGKFSDDKNFSGVMWWENNIDELENTHAKKALPIIKVEFNDTSNDKYRGIMVYNNPQGLNSYYNQIFSFVYYGNLSINIKSNYISISEEDVYLLICNRFGSYSDNNNNKLIMYNDKKHELNTFIKIDKKLVYLHNNNNKYKHLNYNRGYTINSEGSINHYQYENNTLIFIANYDSKSYHTNIQYNNNNTYEGKISLRNFFIKLENGVMTYENGDVYAGEWANDKRQGTGKIIYRNGDVYEGNWMIDKRYGKGRMTYQNGDVYEGNWMIDKRHGPGERMTYQNGDVYYGEWENDKRHGTGKMTYQNRDVYDGYWTNDKREGRGKMTYQNGDVYVGKWKNDKREGTGKMTYKNRDDDEYVGEWENDKRHGTGKMTYKNEDVYVGEWKNDQREGRGNMTYTNGDDYEYDGEWKNDKREGRGKMIYNYNNKYDYVYVGEWKNDKREGRGNMTYKNEDVYVGEWKNDKREGRGEMRYYKDTEAYIGEWKNDKREGYGAYYSGYYSVKSGRKNYKLLYYGIWENRICKLKLNNIDNLKVEDIELWRNQKYKIHESILQKEVMDIFSQKDEQVYEHLKKGQIVFHIYGTELFYIISREILKTYCNDPNFIIYTCNEDGTAKLDVPYLYLPQIQLYQLLPISKLKKIIETESKEYQFIILKKSDLQFKSTISEKKLISDIESVIIKSVISGIKSGNLICEPSNPKNKDIYSMYRLNWEVLLPSETHTQQV